MSPAASLALRKTPNWIVAPFSGTVDRKVTRLVPPSSSLETSSPTAITSALSATAKLVSKVAPSTS